MPETQEKPTLLNRIEVVEGDITKQQVDAIVNAANEALMPGGGVSGAVHRAAGPGLFEECRKLGICAEGEAKITKGYLLPAKWVIHTVGPVWEGGSYGEDETLALCYRNSFALAELHGIRSIAFPAISAGVYEFPYDRASRIAVSETKKFLETNNTVEKVIFVCFGNEAYKIYQETVKEVLSR